MKTILRNQRGNYAGAMEDEEGRDAVLCRKKVPFKDDEVTVCEQISRSLDSTAA